MLIQNNFVYTFSASCCENADFFQSLAQQLHNSNKKWVVFLFFQLGNRLDAVPERNHTRLNISATKLQFICYAHVLYVTGTTPNFS